VDLVAIASQRAAGVKGLVLGSVTQHVLRLSGRPVLVVRPEKG
jgi:nucleotide-binding universal stress UspA family protein